jgi:translation initiation factor IF-1
MAEISWEDRALGAEGTIAALMADKVEMENAIREGQLRLCRFMPGDRVLVLLSEKLEGGVVTKVQIPGPIREEQTVYVELDDVDAGELYKKMWFDPDKVERLDG